MSGTAMAVAAGFVQQLADDLNKGKLELPMFPDSVLRLQRAFQASEVDIDEVVQVISSDPALAARVLHLSNSAALRGRVEIVDVRQAVLRIGNRLVQSSVVAYALRQAERNQRLDSEARKQLKAIWEESIELAARCHVIAKTFTRLNADEALLTGLVSVLGRLYIFSKAQEHSDVDFSDLGDIVDEWHPAIAKAIAESWEFSAEFVNALETQLDTDPPIGESATLAEVLASARLILTHELSGDLLDAEQYPLLQRLGIANQNDQYYPLSRYSADIDAIRNGLKG